MAGGRIPDSFIHDLLSRTDIVEVVGSRVELKRAGREFKGLSPFTNEKSPSFFVNPAKQMFFDFSSGKNGTAITFLMENDRLSFVEAVEELAKRAGVEVPREGGNEGPRLVLDGPLDALAVAEKFYRSQLKTHPPAIDYLKQRGLDGDTAKLFNIGFAPESWDALTRLFPETDGQRQHALDAGLLIERDGGGAYDRFRNRVMFPIRDTRGRTIGFGGRTLANDPAKYLNSPETPLFHKGRNLFGLFEAKQSTKAELPYLLVVEGYMDVVMLAQHGIRNAVATLGTATTREHLTLLFKSTRRAVFCFDGDRAGRSAAWRALEQALPEVFDDRECRFMFLPDGHDPDSLVQEIGADAFRALIDKAQPLSDFLLDELLKQVNLANREGRARLPGLARPHLDKLRDGALRTLIVDRLLTLTRMQRDDLEAALAAAGKAAPTTTDSGGERGRRVETPGSKPVRIALQLLLEAPALAARAEHLGQIAMLNQPGLDILLDTIEFFSENPEAHAAQWLEMNRGSARGAALTRISAMPLPITGDLGAEFTDCLSLLRKRAVRERQQALLDLARDRELAPAEQAELMALMAERTG
ncbi:DNA primase [Nevskia sp.]|uniref:DNA primase n=1 Tax=Nevskia sp. TaxID=1929292 RepID=UPI003F71613D